MVDDTGPDDIDVIIQRTMSLSALLIDHCENVWPTLSKDVKGRDSVATVEAELAATKVKADSIEEIVEVVEGDNLISFNK